MAKSKERESLQECTKTRRLLAAEGEGWNERDVKLGALLRIADALEEIQRRLSTIADAQPSRLERKHIQYVYDLRGRVKKLESQP